MPGKYMLGIDCGTQSLRSAVVNLEGKLVGSATQACPVTHPRVGWAEQNADDWWAAAKATVPQALAQAGVSASDIAGVAVDGTSCTVVVADEKLRPLRPVILWMDQRAHEQADRVTATGDPILRYVGGSDSPEWMLPKALWLKENEPDTYERATWIFEGTDWLLHRLTGETTASLNCVTCKWNYARPEGGWSQKMLQAIGLDGLPGKWPTRIVATGEQVGQLTADAAAALGLNPGTPVAEAGIDAYAAMLGLNVVQPGRMALVMGSSTCHMALCRDGIFGTGVWGPYPDALLPGTWVLEGGQTATGSIVKWFKDNFGAAQIAEARQRGLDPYEVLDEQAARVPPGCEGVVLLDYFQGNRTPLRDPLARGMVWGLSLPHTPAHLFRAIYEGTAMGTRHILEDIAQGGFEATGIYACGGGARSRLWLQIHADVCQVPIMLTAEPEATVLGTAMCAAVGAGVFGSLPQASETMVHITDQIDPDPDQREVYDFYFDKYVRTYGCMKDLMHEVARENQ
jgi:FGGY-family pentulose kinase